MMVSNHIRNLKSLSTHLHIRLAQQWQGVLFLSSSVITLRAIPSAILSHVQCAIVRVLVYLYHHHYHAQFLSGIIPVYGCGRNYPILKCPNIHPPFGTVECIFVQISFFQVVLNFSSPCALRTSSLSFSLIIKVQCRFE